MNEYSRWLRARKFHVEDTIQMVEEATEFRAEQIPDEFHPDPKRALGVEPAIYISQYPQQYVGYARNGSPLFLSKPGALHVNGMECVTTLQGILNYHWFGMMHDYVHRLQIQAASNPNFKRYEVIYVMDLDGLTPSQVSKRAIHIIKVQSQIDSICFPETLHRLILINAPSFFALTWKLIKNFVDARTCNKVEIIGTNRAKWKARLRELADDDNLPADYGGTAPTTDVFLPRYCDEIENLHLKGGTREGFHDKNNDILMDGSDPYHHGDQPQQQQLQRDHINNVSYIGHAISVRSKESQRIILPNGTHMKLSIFTRSLDGAKLQIVSPSGQRLLEGVSGVHGEGILVKHVGAGTEEETPTRMDIDIVFQDPGRYKLKFESLSGPFGSEHFLIAVQLYKPSTDTTNNNKDTSTLSKGDETTNVERMQATSFDSDNAELVDVCLEQLSPCHDKRPHNGVLSLPPSPRVSHDKDGDDFLNVDFVTSFPSPQSITPRNVAHAKRMAACAMLKSQGLLHSDTNVAMDEVEEHDDVPPTGIMCGTMSCWSPWEHLFFSPTTNRSSSSSRSSPNNKKKSSS
eukprot:scaffold133236_cov61-Attheya_sp.AAC.3